MRNYVLGTREKEKKRQRNRLKRIRHTVHYRKGNIVTLFHCCTSVALHECQVNALRVNMKYKCGMSWRRGVTEALVQC